MHVHYQSSIKSSPSHSNVILKSKLITQVFRKRFVSNFIAECCDSMLCRISTNTCSSGMFVIVHLLLLSKCPCFFNVWVQEEFLIVGDFGFVIFKVFFFLINFNFRSTNLFIFFNLDVCMLKSNLK